jgi:hypothetical protein
MLGLFRTSRTAPRNPKAEFSQLQADVKKLRAENAQLAMGHHFAPGHYYSTIANLEEVRLHHDAIFNKIPREIAGIDLNEPYQQELFDAWKPNFAAADFPVTKQDGRRYYTDNNWYPYGDAIVLYSMVRHFRPARIIEVGSGYSSCVILDTNERFFQSRIQCTFIEPEPKRFLQAISPADREQVNLIDNDVRSLAPDFFQSLQAGDILLIDSSHVSKVNSDLNFLLFQVLPQLNKGVFIHFHDIFYPFEYPVKWVYEGWSWNEAYLVRAFLQYNQAFKICFMNTLWYRFHRDQIQAEIPRALNCGGGSLWLQKR